MELFKYGGYIGKVLRVELTTSNIKTEPLKEEYVKKFIGGRGLAAKMLFDELSAKTNPFSPQN
nr:hypothetical protein [Candidatus Bathyarchaeota archaeon]